MEFKILISKRSFHRRKSTGLIFFILVFIFKFFVFAQAEIHNHRKNYLMKVQDKMHCIKLCTPFLKVINWNINNKICLKAAKQEWNITLLKRPHKCYTHMILISFNSVVLSKSILDGQWEAIQVLCKRSIQLLSN